MINAGPQKPAGQPHRRTNMAATLVATTPPT